MLVSFNWLKEHVNIEVSPEELAIKLTNQGLEVVEKYYYNKRIKGLKVGFVSEKIKHPNADTLNLTKIDYLSDEGVKKTDQVICGAANIEAGQKILLATINTVLKENWKIKKSKIRGEYSCGMVCSKAELGKEENSEEDIWVLPNDAELSDDPQKYLGKEDVVFEIDLTSNRSDCLSIYGIAQEVATMFGSYLSLDDVRTFNEYEKKYGLNIEVTDDEGCIRYMMRKLCNVSILPSCDQWQERLFRHGMRSINNVVDITNYLLHEYGQPLHVFDANKVDKEKIIVRRAQEGESFLALNGETYTLCSKDLVIADEKKILALAGVIGGLDSAVDENTKEILIEVAVFLPELVKNTSKLHGIVTDSSKIFEKFVTPKRTNYVLAKAVDLIAKTAKANISSGTFDFYHDKDYAKSKKIFLRFSNLAKVLGQSIDTQEINSIFTGLGFRIVYTDKEKIQVEPPCIRRDINEEWDLIEEIIRIYGYNKIEPSVPFIKNNCLDDSRYLFEKKCKHLAISLGYYEIYTPSFVANKFVEQFSNNHFVRLINPTMIDYSFCRNDLLYGMIKVLKANLERNRIDFNRAFEFGNVAVKTDSFKEKEVLAFIATGYKENPSWRSKNNIFDFYNLSGDCRELLEHLGYSYISFKEKSNIYFSPIASSVILVSNQEIGFSGLLSDEILDFFGIPGKKVYFAQIDLDSLKKIKIKKQKYSAISNYPSIYRDLAIVIDQDQCVSDFSLKVSRVNSLIKSVNVSDIYLGKPLPKNKKSIVFSLEICSNEKTLEKQDADKIVNEIVKKMKLKYEFELR